MTNLDFTVLWRDHGAEKGMTKLGDRTEKTGKSFRALKIAGAAALLAVGTAAVKFGSQSVKAYVEAEGSQIRLQEAFRKFPKLADTNVGSLNKLNSALALKTRFDDDATASGQAVLAQFSLTGTQITKLTPLMQDYAAKTGKDLPAAASVLGKAFLGNTKALKAIGINYKSTGDAGKDFQNIQKLVNEKVGGFAEKEGKSAAGQAAILKNQFGELQEAAGKQLLPALLKVGGGLLKLVGWVQDNSALFKAFGRITGAVFGSFAESVGVGKGAFKNFGDYIETHQADIITGFTKVGKGALAIGDGILVAATVGLRGFAVIMDAQKNSTAGFLFGFGQIVKGAALAFGWIPGIGPKLKASEVQFAMFSRGALIGMDKAAAGARNAADGIDDKLRPALDKAGRKLDEVSRKEIIKAHVRDAVKKAALAIEDLGTKSNGSQIKLKKWADITNLSAKEQKGLNARLTGVKGALRDQLGAMRDAGVGQGKLSKAWEVGRDRLYKEFRQMGVSKEEARKLAVRYAGIKPKVSTKVEQPGMDAARRKTKGLDDDINDINSKSVSVKVRYSASGKVTVGSIKDRKLAGLNAAAGTVLPGWSPGRDIHTFTSPTGGRLGLSGGEAVMVPEWTRAVGGKPAVDRMNKAARRGQRFAGGGLFRTITVRGDANNPPDVSGVNESVVNRVGRYAGQIAVARAEEIGKALAAWQRKAIKKAKAAASGGPVSGGGFAKALSYARRNEGHPYIFGSMWDCSGFISALHNIILGKGPGGRRYSTPAFHGAHAQGFTRGKRSPFMIGVNPAPGRFGHMAGTLNGVNVESAGGVGVRVGGGARGHNSGMFSWRGGLARGGVIGDLPYDLLDPRGQRYDPALAAMVKRLGYGGSAARGGVVHQRSMVQVAEHGPERVLTTAQNRSFEQLVRVASRGGSGGVGKTELHFHFDRFVGSPNDLKREMVAMYRRGDLDVIVGRR